jgi:hypothetical protein
MLTYTELIAETFTLLAQPNSAGNQALVATTVQTHLQRAYNWLAQEARLFRRMATITAIDAQAEYAWPADLVQLEAVRYGSTIMLPYGDFVDLEDDDTGQYWRTQNAGTPTDYLILADSMVRLYPPPSVSTATNLSLYGYCVPYAIGTTIAAIARATDVITITTSAAHRLRGGETVEVSGCSTAGLNVALTVTTVPSTTSFTADQEGDAASDTDGYLRYAGGVLPLLGNSDVPAFNGAYHDILPLRAALTIGTLLFPDDPRVQAKLPALSAFLGERVTALKALQVGG